MSSDSGIAPHVAIEDDPFYSQRAAVEAWQPLAIDKGFPSPASILWHEFFPLGVSRGKAFGKDGGVLLKNHHH